MMSGQSGVASIVLSSALVLRLAVRSAIDFVDGLEWMDAGTSNVMVLTGGPASGRLGSAVVAVLSETMSGASVVLRTRTTAASVARQRLLGSDSTWTDLATPEASERFATVSIPTDIAGPAALCLAVDASDPSSVLETLAAFTRPRQALAARLDRRRLGLAAELAAPLHPRLILVHSMLGSRHLIAATADRIAAELVVLAWRHDAADEERDPVGPWEDRLVQRATELDLGVHLPAHIRVVLAPVEDCADPDVEGIVLVRQRLLTRLGSF